MCVSMLSFIYVIVSWLVDLCGHGHARGYVVPAGRGYGHAFVPVTDRGYGHGYEILLAGMDTSHMYPRGS